MPSEERAPSKKGKADPMQLTLATKKKISIA